MWVSRIREFSIFVRKRGYEAVIRQSQGGPKKEH